MSERDVTMPLSGAPKRPSSRGTVLVGRTQTIAAQHFEKQGGAAPSNAVAVLVGKLIRIPLAAGVLFLSYQTFWQAWGMTLKAEELRPVDGLRLGVAALLFLIGCYIWTPDRTKDGLKLALSVVMAWRKPKADT